MPGRATVRSTRRQCPAAGDGGPGLPLAVVPEIAGRRAPRNISLTPDASAPTKRPAACSLIRPVRCESRTITSSAASLSRGAKSPMVALPQPTRMLAGVSPSITGGRPTWSSRRLPPSTRSFTGMPLAMSTHGAGDQPCRFSPAQLVDAQPMESIFAPYCSVATMPTRRLPAMTGAPSSPMFMSVSILTMMPL